MRWKRKLGQQLSCYRCGRGVAWRDDTSWLLTRVDPHTHVQRPVTLDEMDDARRRHELDGSLRLRDAGIYLAPICHVCAEAAAT
jgi:hypothetical protein